MKTMRHPSAILLSGILLLAMHCKTGQGKANGKNSPYDDISVDKYVSSRTGLKMRKNHHKTAEALGMLSLNTKLHCTLETKKPEHIDGRSAPWFFCESNKYSGWVYGAYTDEEMSIEANKNNEIHSLGNDTADVDLRLQKEGRFKLKFLNLLAENARTTELSGLWKLKKNALFLTFSGKPITENVLFFFPNGKPLADVGNPVTFKGARTYRIDLEEPAIMIWAVRCAVKRVN